MPRKSLADQVMVITGASSGIGLLTARKAAATGAKVFLISRNGEALAAAVRDIEYTGGVAAYAVADVGDRDALDRAAHAASEKFGRIDCWINNAGVAIYAPLLETPLHEHEQLFRTNYFGVVNGTQVAMPYLETTGGALITIGSIAGDMPSPIMGAYAASKHAIHSFIASLRIELIAAGSKVTISLIKPSGMTTPIADHAANHMEGRARIPPPPYDPELAADAILHAATQRVREMTVGGIGRLETLFAAHFPALFDRIAPIITPFLVDRARAAVPGNNLAGPQDGGEMRSSEETGRNTSLLSGIRKHPVVTGAVLAGLALSAIALAGRRQSTANLLHILKGRPVRR